MRETEYKTLIDAEKAAHIVKSLPVENIVIQTNFYFDTIDFSLFNHEITCRIRFVNGDYYLQYKGPRSYNNGIVSRYEYSIQLAENPSADRIAMLLQGVDTRFLNSTGLVLVGVVTTVRYTIKLPDGKFNVDYNSYLGVSDIELEIESNDERKILSILSYLNIDQNSQKFFGKIGRMTERLRMLQTLY